MAEITHIKYTNKELLVMMLKDQGIHEGEWILSARFKHAAINIGLSSDEKDVSPAGISALDGVGIERSKEALPFSVNAAEVNPTEASANITKEKTSTTKTSRPTKKKTSPRNAAKET